MAGRWRRQGTRAMKRRQGKLTAVSGRSEGSEGGGAAELTHQWQVSDENSHRDIVSGGRVCPWGRQLMKV